MIMRESAVIDFRVKLESIHLANGCHILQRLSLDVYGNLNDLKVVVLINVAAVNASGRVVDIISTDGWLLNEFLTYA